MAVIRQNTGGGSLMNVLSAPFFSAMGILARVIKIYATKSYLP